ncbi:hypothetical protein C3L33_11973, partial [Rhododendron williamsianum]
MSDYIPTELLADILVRLPVQSLIRFTSVCKSWYSLITSPSFITKHLNHSSTNTKNLLVKASNFDEKKERYLLCRGDEKFSDEFSELEFPLSTPFGHNTILGSCNGLLCMVNFDSSQGVTLWNPSIKKSVTLPMPSLPQSSRRRLVLGFGAHPKTHEYMVVFIVYEMADVMQRKFPSNVLLYTQGAGSWRSIPSVGHPHCLACDDWFPAFVNGSVHWIALDMRAFDDGIRSLIVLFNMGSQAFSVVMMPAALVAVVSTRHLLQACSLLHSAEFMEYALLFRERYLLCHGDEFAELESPLSTSLWRKRIVGSCNGLVCMVYHATSAPCIILWNPLIRKSVTLPMPPSLPVPETSPLPPFVLGFGAHPTTHEYMLVFIVYEKADIVLEKFPSKVELYTQGTGSWRSIATVESGEWSKLFDNVVQYGFSSVLGDYDARRSS